MKTLVMEDKKLKVTLQIDIESNLCLSSSGDIKYFDEGLLLKTFSDLKAANKKGSFHFMFTAISERAKDKIIRRDNIWLSKQNNKTLNGGIFTMLKNKGYDS